MIKSGYSLLINEAETLDELDLIIETAAGDFDITNSEYADVYSHSLRKAQSWCYAKVQK